jgi:signal transduction histidine kinase
VPISPPFASTAARLSLLYAGLLVASFLVAGSLTFLATRSAAQDELRERILLEVEALTREANVEGRDAAIAAIAARAERPGAVEYWLIDADGHRLAGDLPAPTVDDGWSSVRIADGQPGSEGRAHLLVLTRRLSDGSRLSVGDDLARVEAVRDAVLRTLAWVGAGTAFIGLFAGVLATRSALTRMAALSSTVDQVAAGALDARAPVRHARAPDDIDRLALAFNAMLQRIVELVGSVRRVSTDVAHDLRTPLTQLRQRIEQARLATEPEVRSAAFDAAEEKLDDVMRTFDAILRLAEIEVGTARARFAPVDLAKLVDDVVDAYQPDVEAADRRLCIVRLDAATIRGDRDLLKQALANLIENSQRHTPTGTRIRVSSVVKPAAIEITVSDDGPGIPLEARTGLLEPFARLDRSRSTSGAGLGLSIVAAVARLHGGRVELGDAGPGLKVVLTIPVD